MIRTVGAFCFVGLLFVGSCAPAGETPAPKEEPNRNLEVEQPYSEAPDNVLSLAAGAVVIDRTGEASLEASPIQAIDGARETAWGSPSGDVEQSATFSFPALTRVESFGLSVSDVPPQSTPRNISIEGSADGRTFFPIGRAQPKPKQNGQWFPLTPADLRAVRVSILDVPSDGDAFAVQALEVRGRRLQPVTAPDITGEWQINEKRAVFRQEGRRFEGVVFAAMPMHIAGSVNGNVLPFIWTRVNQAGFGLMTIDAESRHLSGLFWYEAPIALFSGGGWFGTRRSSSAEFERSSLTQMAPVFMRVKQFVPSYQVHFDAKGEVEGSDSVEVLRSLRDFASANPKVRFRLSAQYFGRSSAQENRAVTDLRAAAMRRALAANGGLPPNLDIGSIGGEVASDPPRTATERVLYDRVELQVSVPGS
jgi:hypothetical protein